MEQILISMDNIQKILEGFVNDLKNKINNKDLSTPYIDQFTKAGLIKTDGNGDMFLCNNGEYVKIDLNKISITQEMINIIYDLFKIEKHDTKCSTGKSMVISRNAPSSCVYEDNIYVFGGVANDSDISSTNKVEIYNTKTNTWNYGTDMVCGSGWMSTIINNNKIYCIGGHSTNLNRIYDIETNTWTYGANLNNNKHAFTCETYNNKIYCIGGYSSSSNPCIALVEIYDINSNIWSIGLHMPTARVALDSVIYNEKIYCIGGYNGTSIYLNNIEVYDIKSNTWNTLNTMITARRGLKCQIYNDKIYCIGGVNNNVLNIVEVYDIKNNLWNSSTSLLYPKYAFTSEIIKDKIYCIGGYNRNIAFNSVDILSLPYISYDIKLPEELDNKLNIIKSDGLGNKLLADNGNYIDPSNNYVSMTPEQVSAMINSLGV